MKRILAVFSACVMLTACGAESTQTGGESQSESTVSASKEYGDPDFRNVCWGMTREEVMEREGKECKDTGRSLIYENVTVLNYNAELLYYFTEKEGNGVIEARYTIPLQGKVDYSYNNQYVEIYNALCEKYGKPETDSYIVQYQGKEYFYPTEFYEEDFSYDSMDLYLYNASWKYGKSRVSIDMNTEKDSNGKRKPQDITVRYSVDISSAEYDNGL